MTRVRAVAAVAVLGVLSFAPRLEAQGGRGRGRAAAGQLPPGGGRAGGGRASPEERALRRQINQRFNEVVKKQLGLNDEQAARLQQTDQKFQRQRSDLTKDERDARQGLRAMLDDSTTSPDPAKVDQYLTRLLQAQRKRADVLEAEQKELAGFLNPVQRAKLLGLREQLRARMQSLQQGERGRGAPPPPS